MFLRKFHRSAVLETTTTTQLSQLRDAECRSAPAARHDATVLSPLRAVAEATNRWVINSLCPSMPLYATLCHATQTKRKREIDGERGCSGDAASMAKPPKNGPQKSMSGPSGPSCTKPRFRQVSTPRHAGGRCAHLRPAGRTQKAEFQRPAEGSPFSSMFRTLCTCPEPWGDYNIGIQVPSQKVRLDPPITF